MFIRGKFVTNSSSTSFIGFGVWLENKELSKLILSMSENMSDPELKKFLWLDDKELNDFKEDRQTFIEGSDHYALPDMVGSALNVTATSPDYYSGVYLHVGMPDIHMDFETGAIAVSGSEKVLENGKKLLAALKKAQLAESLGIVSDSWYNG